MTDYSILRNYDDKPWIWPAGATPGTGEWRNGKDRKGKPKTWWFSKEATAYNRASGTGDGLKDGSGLIDWASCRAAVGMVLDPDARSQVVTLVNEFDADPWGKGDDGTAYSGKKRLLSAVEQAKNTAGANVASSSGTEMHKLVELANQGITPRVVQDHLVDHLAQYQWATRNVKFLKNEFFFIQDELQVAGTSDGLIELPAGLTTPDGVYHEDPIVCAEDFKTGKWDARYPLGVLCQVAAAGTGTAYDQEKNVRSALHPNMNTDFGVMIHFPIMTKDPLCKLYWLDLSLGLDAARLARDANAMRSKIESKKNTLRELVVA